LDNQDLILSKKLIITYKERLEKEIKKRSNNLRIPQPIAQKIITNNNEMNRLEKAIKDIDAKFKPDQQSEE